MLLSGPASPPTDVVTRNQLQLSEGSRPSKYMGSCRTLLVMNSSLPRALRGGGIVSGGQQRLSLIIRALSELGPTDLVLISNDTADGQLVGERYQGATIMGVAQAGDNAAAASSRMGELLFRLRHNLRGWTAALAERSALADEVCAVFLRRQYDLIVAEDLIVASTAGVTRHHPNIVDRHDQENEIYRSRLAQMSTFDWRRPILLRHLYQLDHQVPAILERCDRIWSAAPEDRLRLGISRTDLVPNVVFEFPSEVVWIGDSPTLLVVGSYFHSPNVEGVDRFLRESWPVIRARTYEPRLRIVGSAISREMLERWRAHPGVKVVGYVDDLAREYGRATAVVAPIFWGSGTKIKVLEALAHGRPCVTTAHGSRGFDLLSPNTGLMVARDGHDLGRQCAELLNHPQRCRDLGVRGRSIVNSNYSYSALQRAVESSVVRAVGPYPVDDRN